MKMTISRAEFLASLNSNTKPVGVQEELAIVAAFPSVDPGNYPFGSRVMVQLRLAPRKSRGGIVLAGESQDAEKWNTGVAQVIALGPLAFKKRDSMQPWPEGAWCGVGDFVRVPKFGGDRWEVPVEDTEGQEERAARLVEVESKMADYSGGPVYDKLYREREQLKLPLPPILVMFAIFNDTECIAKVLGNPCDVRVYI